MTSFHRSFRDHPLSCRHRHPPPHRPHPLSFAGRRGPLGSSERCQRMMQTPSQRLSQMRSRWSAEWVERADLLRG